MNENTDKRSKMSQEFDEALEKNSVAPGEHLVGRGLDRNTDPIPASTDMFAPQNETKISAGDDIRDHDFPLPEGRPSDTDRGVAVGPPTIPDPGPAGGGKLGTMPGDRQNVGVIGDILDQHDITPHLIEQQDR